MRTVVITGANRGIGLALAKRFVNNGDKVIGLCRHASEELVKSGAQVIESVDVTDYERLQEVAREISDIDILINNAGVLIADDMKSVQFNDIQKQLEVNTLGPLKVALTLGRKVKVGGKLGILTSRMGSIADNTTGGYYGYRSSKAAANAIGKSLAEDFRSDKICVLLLHPGYVKTDMTDHHGNIGPKEAADGLFKVIEAKGMQDTGTFWHSSGEELPW